MRVTNNMMISTLMRNMTNNMQQLDSIQTKLSTGRKLNKPADDPAGLVKSLRLRSSLVESDQYLENIDDSISYMETTDSALNNLNEVLSRVRELTVQAANDTNDDDALKSIAQEIAELREQVKTVANTTYGSKYVFAGSNVTEPPCSGTQWTGNGNLLEREIGAGVTIPINSDMRAFFGNPNGLDGLGNPDGGIFDVLNQLETEITAGNTAGINTQLEQVDLKIDDLLTSRSTIGAKINRLEMQQTRLESNQTSFTELLANTEDADMAEVAIQLQAQENVYRACLAAGAQIIQPTLMDFLR